MHIAPHIRSTSRTTLLFATLAAFALALCIMSWLGESAAFGAGKKAVLTTQIVQNAIAISKLADTKKFDNMTVASVSQTAAPSSSHLMTASFLLTRGHKTPCGYQSRFHLVGGNIHITRLYTARGCPHFAPREVVSYTLARDWKNGA